MFRCYASVYDRFRVHKEIHFLFQLVLLQCHVVLMELKSDQAFESRKKISALLGGDVRKGIAKSAKTNTILLFTCVEVFIFYDT